MGAKPGNLPLRAPRASSGTVPPSGKSQSLQHDNKEKRYQEKTEKPRIKLIKETK